MFPQVKSTFVGNPLVAYKFEALIFVFDSDCSNSVITGIDTRRSHLCSCQLPTLRVDCEDLGCQPPLGPVPFLPYAAHVEVPFLGVLVGWVCPSL